MCDAGNDDISFPIVYGQVGGLSMVQFLDDWMGRINEFDGDRLGLVFVFGLFWVVIELVNLGGGSIWGEDRFFSLGKEFRTDKLGFELIFHENLLVYSGLI